MSIELDLSAIQLAAKRTVAGAGYVATAATVATTATKPADSVATVATVATVASSHGQESTQKPAKSVASVATVATVASSQRLATPEKAPTVAPALDPGLPRLLGAAMALCDRTNASDKTRQDWRADIEATLPEHRADLLALVQALMPKAMPPTVVAAAPNPAPTQTWRQHDKADQLHYWSCPQCLAVVKTGTGKRCTTGQQLHDAYIEAATREGRFIGATPDPAKPLPPFHAAQPWRALDREFQAHYWQCPECKAGGRTRGPLCPTGTELHQQYEQAAAPKEST
jgi:rubredoxin